MSAKDFLEAQNGLYFHCAKCKDCEAKLDDAIRLIKEIQMHSDSDKT